MVASVKHVHVPDTCDRIVICGGPYSNFAAVTAFLTTTADKPYRLVTGYVTVAFVWEIETAEKAVRPRVMA
ncbi:hypothetical protein D0962_09650 [Leptolyngbyaceae cyanobacterium CCMR0082]|uniref:Uncharacterized protein n=1 Tax=Adonisia turfae CCMR0082 TaxID=2304604 RepID=A0A6M0S509_9CYAN|nr:hypothetical protein [Adonisia turfae]NEZ63041.1 hypothetical protein [Adonisia turfae CCMR0082]